MLTATLMKDIVTDAFKESFYRRFPNNTQIFSFDYEPSTGTMKVSFSLENKNLSSVVVSLRGEEYMYKVIERFEKCYPELTDLFRANKKPDYPYHKDTPWCL